MPKVYTIETYECPSKHNEGGCENRKIIEPALEKLAGHQS